MQYNNQKMNILIANISVFSPNKNEMTYEVRVRDCDVKEVTAYHTNESILKCLSQIAEVKNSGGVKKIIALVSNRVLEVRDVRYENFTAYEYVKQKAEESIGYVPEFVEVRIETDDKRERNTASILNDICSNIALDDVVYIDAAGGMRTISNIIQMLTNLLEFKGMKSPLSLYSNIQNKPAFITDTKEFDRMSDLTNAFNEFMTTGKSTLLHKCVEETSDIYRELVNSMCDFSDKINLGKVDNLENTLLSLRETLIKCKKELSTKDLESVVINQFLPVIEQRFFGNTNNKEIDYIKLVQWCLDNDLLQQALTIFTEKIPISIFEKDIIYYSGDIELAKNNHTENVIKNPLLAHDWETAMLYSEIMTTKIAGGNKALIQEFIDCLEKGRKMSDNKNNDVLEEVRRFKIKGVSNGKTAEMLKNFCKVRRFVSEKSMINSIVNNHQFIGQLLGLTYEVKQNEDKMADKFAFVEALKNGKVKTKGDFSFGRGCVDVMYGYLYVKSVRNTVNHASSEENLNEEQKQVLSKLGYDFSAYNFTIVKKNISKALNAIKNANVEETNLLKTRRKGKEKIRRS